LTRALGHDVAFDAAVEVTAARSAQWFTVTIAADPALLGAVKRIADAYRVEQGFHTQITSPSHQPRCLRRKGYGKSRFPGAWLYGPFFQRFYRFRRFSGPGESDPNLV
jgi:hypothetical protein